MSPSFRPKNSDERYNRKQWSTHRFFPFHVSSSLSSSAGLSAGGGDPLSLGVPPDLGDGDGLEAPAQPTDGSGLGETIRENGRTQLIFVVVFLGLSSHRVK